MVAVDGVAVDGGCLTRRPANDGALELGVGVEAEVSGILTCNPENDSEVVGVGVVVAIA